jgi:Glycosyltransferase family 29 (sialyltransferase)
LLSVGRKIELISFQNLVAGNACQVVAQSQGRVAALVGNARSLLAEQRGIEIDACDVVLRMNKASGMVLSSHGKKTTWLATSLPVELTQVKILQPDNIFFMSPKKRWRSFAMRFFGFPFAYYPVEEWQALRHMLGGKRPSTGMMAISLLMRHGRYFEEIRLYGFDFSASGSLTERLAKTEVPHDFALEHRIILELIENNPRFKLVTSKT